MGDSERPPSGEVGVMPTLNAAGLTDAPARCAPPPSSSPLGLGRGGAAPPPLLPWAGPSVVGHGLTR